MWMAIRNAGRNNRSEIMWNGQSEMQAEICGQNNNVEWQSECNQNKWNGNQKCVRNMPVTNMWTGNQNCISDCHPHYFWLHSIAIHIIFLTAYFCCILIAILHYFWPHYFCLHFWLPFHIISDRIIFDCISDCHCIPHYFDRIILTAFRGAANCEFQAVYHSATLL